MDNFMDKLAEKYNATDMIKANSQAETAQMQSLQEQVESYETVLQEMRKLNYKNSELTEKMYALVDESLEKVRTLQIEAKEGGATPEAASIEMSEAVGRAVSEAVDSMDISGIKDQLFEIRQSNTNTEESLNDLKRKFQQGVFRGGVYKGTSQRISDDHDHSPKEYACCL